MLPQSFYSCHCTRAQRRRFRSPQLNSSGFSLVEIMVGMVLGLLGMVVILQVFALFEGQKRTTTGGDDAQNSAAIAMASLERDIQQAGYGFSDVSLLGCNTTVSTVTVPIVPVIINPATTVIPAADSHTDRLLVFYGNTNGMAEGTSIDSSTGTSYKLKIPGSTNFNNLDKVVAAPLAGDPVSAVTCTSTMPIQQVSGVPDVSTSTVNIASGTAGSGALFNLGAGPKMLAYAIYGGNLKVCDYFAKNCGDSTKTADDTIWVPIAYGVVSLKAQYGRDNTAGAMVGVVKTYDQTTPSTNCDWLRTSAVRLALVARNGQLEKGDVTTSAPAWAGSGGDAIDLSADPKWKQYRYKVLQTVVPIRNVVWMGVKTGC